MFSSIGVSFSQGSDELLQVPIHSETIKIVDPVTNQNVSLVNELVISGSSSASQSRNCTVSIIVNDVRPYQDAIPSGPAGEKDFSQWKFILHDKYTRIVEGKNKITAKLMCMDKPTRWNSVFVDGVSTYSKDIIPIQEEDQSNKLEKKLLDKDENNNKNTNALLISIAPQKNPVARGDTQTATITVTDSLSRTIPNANINGRLIYPGDNFEKEFSGKTDSNGKFVYSWNIGKKGDSGSLKLDVQASRGIESSLSSIAFEIVDSTGKSIINDGLNENEDNAGSEFDFVVAGDYGCDLKTRETVRNMEKVDPDLVFALGDLSEVKNPKCFFDIISNLDDDEKFKISFGDADIDNYSRVNSRYAEYIEHFDLDSPYYSFDYENVHFLAMSTGKNMLVPYETGSAQYEFIDDDLSKAANNKNIDWIIVYGYKPFYTSPTIHPGSQVLRDTYLPLFQKYGVDLVITSHNHNYQRSYPLLYNIESPKNPIIKDTSTNHYNDPRVPVYVVVGTASENLYDFIGQEPYMVTQARQNGFLHVSIANTDEHTLTGTFHDLSEDFEDKFVIAK